MSEALSKALTIAAIGLPVMFGIIGFFILLAKVLMKLFPHKAEAKVANYTNESKR